MAVPNPKFVISEPSTSQTSKTIIECPICKSTLLKRSHFLEHVVTTCFKDQLNFDLSNVEYIQQRYECPVCLSLFRKCELMLHYAIQHKMILKYLNEHAGISNSFNDSILLKYEVKNLFSDDQYIESPVRDSTIASYTGIQCLYCKHVTIDRKSFYEHLCEIHFKEELLKECLSQSHLTPFKCPIQGCKWEQLEFQIDYSLRLVKHYGIDHKSVKKYFPAKVGRFVDVSLLLQQMKQQTQQKEQTEQQKLDEFRKDKSNFFCLICRKMKTHSIHDFCKHLIKEHFYNEIRSALAAKGINEESVYECPEQNCNFVPQSKSKQPKWRGLLIHYGVEHKILFKLLNEREGIFDRDDYTILKYYKKGFKNCYEEKCPFCDNKFSGNYSQKRSVQMTLMHHICTSENHLIEKLLELFDIDLMLYENNANIFQCPKCPFKFQSVNELAIHYGLKHGIVQMFLKELNFKEGFDHETPEILGYFELELIKGMH